MIPKNIRAQFPILDTQVHGHRLVYLDNAATTQKPLSVVNALSDYYLTLNSNIHRGAHHLAAEATERYEAVRRQVQAFVNARHSHEIVFTRGTTESINLVAASFGRKHIHPGDEVIVSGMEHHSDIVPWQLAGAILRPIPFSDEGVLDLEAYKRLFSDRTRIVAVNHVSNTLGTVNPIREIVEIAHALHYHHASAVWTSEDLTRKLEEIGEREAAHKMELSVKYQAECKKIQSQIGQLKKKQKELLQKYQNDKIFFHRKYREEKHEITAKMHTLRLEYLTVNNIDCKETQRAAKEAEV